MSVLFLLNIHFIIISSTLAFAFAYLTLSNESGSTKEMDIQEQQALQMLRQQNLVLLEQLRRGQHAMRNILSAGESSSQQSLSSAGSSDISNIQDTREFNVQVHVHTPKKNVSFSENDLSHIYDFERESSRTPSPSREKKLARQKSPSRSRSPKQPLFQGVLRQSPSGGKKTSLLSTSLTSTPNASMVEKADTPRSILKRRKIIDDNVRVDSKFAHTPTSGRSPKDKRGLNFSYSDYNDLNYGLENIDINRDVTDSVMRGKHKYSDATDGSYIDEYLDTSVADVEQDLQDIKARKSDQTTPKKGKKGKAKEKEVEAMLRARLVKDSGNDRKQAKVVRDLSKRPKSAVFDMNNQPRVVVHKSPKPSPQRKTTLVKTKKGEKTPLLGYDWIAGVLENESAVLNNSEDYFDDIMQFRKENKDECASTTFNRNLLDLTKPISPEIKSPTHTCIHGYTISDRLFTEPMNVDENGLSVCPVCLIPRKEPSAQSPGFVRVSVPRSTLESPYKVKPHRRRSFDPTDSCALSKHCLAGWESSKPSQIPAASSVDLRQASEGIKGKQSMTFSDSEREAMSFSRSATLLNGTNTTNTSKMSTSGINSTLAGLANSGSQLNRSAFTDELLDTSHSLRFNLQQLEQSDGLGATNPPHSTRYPLL